tara:strand:+ start:1878 stop:3680 length:1803 start_codon:yes stop_codon:yes gene_type:complete
MPVIPSVFQPIRANDYQQRPFKAYKRYQVNSVGFTTGSGYFRHNALYRKVTPHILSDTGQGTGTRIYPVNSEDKTNQHVIWNAIDHKYYRNNNPAHAADFLDIETQQRFLWYSASMFTVPYGQVGEKIKHGTFNITSSIGNTVINLLDDGAGNLYDPIIDSTTFASSSRNFFYMPFNDMYQKFNSYDDIGSYTGNIKYQLNHVDKKATVRGSVTIVPGIEVTSSAVAPTPSGLAIQIPATAGSSIRIPHHDKFNRISDCNDWTISLWHKRSSTVTAGCTVFSKFAVTEESYLDKVDGKRKTRTKELNDQAIFPNINTAWDGSQAGHPLIRMPFHLACSSAADNTIVAYKFSACNGTELLTLSSGGHTTSRDWDHVCIRNIGNNTEIFVNGNTVTGAQSGSLPAFSINNADIILGNTTTGRLDGGGDQQIAEFRMYDYGVSTAGIESLANNHYISASCYQTNVVGNVFYKNAQAVVSSPLPKYNSGSGIFGNTWNLDYRGTHTIYENECLVRVPKGQFNVTMNPTSTYRPVTVGEPCNANQSNMPPGELRKSLFISGTLKPYITTIGLYNHNAEMIATAKLAQPIQKNPDVDMNFIVRWDY